MRAHAEATRPARPGSLRPATRPATLLVAALVIGAASFAAVATRPAPAPPATSVPAVALPGAPQGVAEGTQAQLERIGSAIAVWSGNLERDGADFIAATNLANLYLARARVTGAADDYDRSRQAVDQALATDPSLLSARVLRAQVLFASHDFATAEDAAAALLADHPGLPQALATLGDARLERGDYIGASDAYAQVDDPPTAPVLARQARLAALTGSLETAREVAARASAMALADPQTGQADGSFYHVLDGALAFQAGDLPAAVTAYRAAVEAWPASHQALFGLGRALAASGDLPGAVAAYEAAARIAPQPETLSALGDVLALTGAGEEAETRYRQVRGIAALEGEAGLYNRAIVLFLANHGEDPARAVTLAAAELEVRRDVYGWDAYAWALFAAGRFDEADAAMATARAQGTTDALLDYHAGMIAAALGRTAEAAQLLQAALDRNPGFDPLQAQRARDTLAGLGAPS